MTDFDLEPKQVEARHAAEGRYNWAAQAVGLRHLYVGVLGGRP